MLFRSLVILVGLHDGAVDGFDVVGPGDARVVDVNDDEALADARFLELACGDTAHLQAGTEAKLFEELFGSLAECRAERCHGAGFGDAGVALGVAESGYMGALMAMSEFDQKQLLNGNWKIRRSAGHYFKCSKVTPLAAIPTDIVKWVREIGRASCRERV